MSNTCQRCNENPTTAVLCTGCRTTVRTAMGTEARTVYAARAERANLDRTRNRAAWARLRGTAA